MEFIKKRITVFILFFEIIILLSSLGLLYQINSCNKELYISTEQRLNMTRAAEMLRQSSDDLTHFARTYVVTKDIEFKNRYFTTLEIRNGIKPRPQNYNEIYWDLEKSIRMKKHPDGKKLSLDSIFKSLPFSKDEYKKLALSEANSNHLVNLEIKAFNAMEGKFQDSKGEYTIKKEPDQELAIKLLHSKEYYGAKHEIMNPIDDFMHMLDERTKNNISTIESTIDNYLFNLTLIILIFIIGNIVIYRYLRVKDQEKTLLLSNEKKLNKELEENRSKMQQLNVKLENFNHILEKTVEEQTKELTKHAEIISKHVLYTRTDLKGKITDTSDAFCELSGYTRQELIGKAHNIVRHPDSSAVMFKHIWEQIKANKMWQGEIKDLKKDGTDFWVFADIAPEFNINGEKKGYISIKHDITANKDFEQQQIQLMESAKLASMGEMIANIAHQWRQPLSVISSGITGMKMQKEFNTLTDEEFLKTCDTINENAQYLSKTIDTFRNFIKEKKEIKDVVLQDRIDIALNVISTTLKNKHITLKNNIDYHNPINVKIVTGELSQVIINIINNAKDVLLEKAVKDPWVELNLIKHNDKVILSVEDNGGGISDEIMPHIFEPYFTTKHQSQGTGLGLHMAYKIIVESLKGKLTAKNTENGAIFFIELPLFN